MILMFRPIFRSLGVAAIVAAVLTSTAGSLSGAAQQATGSASSDQPPLTFRVEANFVEVDAFVGDSMGNPVTNLRAEDFQLFEDGKPQKVSAFSFVNIPIRR